MIGSVVITVTLCLMVVCVSACYKKTIQMQLNKYFCLTYTSLIKLAFLYMIDKNLRNRRERVVDQTGSFEFVSFPAFFMQQKSYHDDWVWSSDNYKDLTSHSLQGNINMRTSPIVIHVLIGLQAPTVASQIVKVYRVTYASMVEPYS